MHIKEIFLIAVRGDSIVESKKQKDRLQVLKNLNLPLDWQVKEKL